MTLLAFYLRSISIGHPFPHWLLTDWLSDVTLSSGCHVIGALVRYASFGPTDLGALCLLALDFRDIEINKDEWEGRAKKQMDEMNKDDIDAKEKLAKLEEESKERRSKLQADPDVIRKFIKARQELVKTIKKDIARMEAMNDMDQETFFSLLFAKGNLEEREEEIKNASRRLKVLETGEESNDVDFLLTEGISGDSEVQRNEAGRQNNFTAEDDNKNVHSTQESTGSID